MELISCELNGKKFMIRLMIQLRSDFYIAYENFRYIMNIYIWLKTRIRIEEKMNSSMKKALIRIILISNRWTKVFLLIRVFFYIFISYTGF